MRWTARWALVRRAPIVESIDKEHAMNDSFKGLRVAITGGTSALGTNVLGPFRLTKALLGALSASAREGRPALVVNITSDAAVNAYAGWGAYGASKAALSHLSLIWDEELREHGIRILALDPGDMDTPLHAAALPDTDPSTLKRPADAAGEILAVIEEAIA